MVTRRCSWVAVALVIGLVLAGSAARAEDEKDKLGLDKIPKAVMDALKEKFPRAKIHKWTKEKEGDAEVYDIEFKQDGRKFEADIKEDGTIVNWEKEIAVKDLPAAVLKAVKSGEVTEDRLDASVLRILEHKMRNGLFPRPYVDEKRAARVVGNRRHTADCARITDRTITLVRNEGSTLPLSAAGRTVLVTGWDTSQVATVAGTVGKRSGQSATALATGATPTAAKIEEAGTAAGKHDVTVVLTNAAASAKDKGAAQADLVKALVKTGKPVVAVAVRNAYDIRRFPDVSAYLATFSYGKPSLTSLVRAIYGDIDPAGKLPVSIPALDESEGTLYEFGHGLSY